MSGWYDDAACAGMDVKVWLDPKIPSYVSRALFVCSLCPVKVACIRAAVENGDRGIRGGLTYHERRKVHRLPIAHRVAS